MISQRRENSCRIFCCDCLPEGKLRRQQTGTLFELIALLIKQAQENTLTDRQLLRNGLSGDLIIGCINDQKRQALHQH